MLTLAPSAASLTSPTRANDSGKPRASRDGRRAFRAAVFVYRIPRVRIDFDFGRSRGCLGGANAALVVLLGCDPKQGDDGEGSKGGSQLHVGDFRYRPGCARSSVGRCK